MKTYGLIGENLSHSFSKKYFQNKFISNNIEAQYLNIEFSNINQLLPFIENNSKLCGLNVTIPYKTEIIKYMDSVDTHAAKINAVNTVYIDRKNKKLKGYNTDYLGFLKTIPQKVIEKNYSALVLGTGGASKAVQYALKIANIDFIIASRQKQHNSISYKEIENYLHYYKFIVNTTPVGMFPNINEEITLPYEKINQDFICYDLIYNPKETAFLKNAKNNGAVIKNGYEMLVIQAEASWQIWNNAII